MTCTHFAMGDRTACDRLSVSVLVLTPRVDQCDCPACLVDIARFAPAAMAHEANHRLAEIAARRCWPIAADND